MTITNDNFFRRMGTNYSDLDTCFPIKEEAYDQMIGVYREVYREDYDMPISRFIDPDGNYYYRFFGTKNDYLEFKNHFWDHEWPKYFYD